MKELYICDNCGYESNKFFMLCPKCKEGIGVLNEIENSKTNTKNKNCNNIIPNIRKVDLNMPEQKSIKSTPFIGLNSIISSSKGFIEGQVILLAASPGVGKSTLCISIADKDTLYISSEENYNQVNNRAIRVNPTCECSILNSTSIDEILTAIKQSNEKLIIIDSLNSIEFGVGYLTVAKYANEIINLIKELNKIAIIISQVGKTGEVTGMNAISHMVDTILFLEKSEISNNIIATTSKNRYGEVGGVCLFTHKNNGFEEVELDYDPNILELGSTYTTTRFGYTNIRISIESLVTKSLSRYGFSRSNGYNNNRLIQLLGILGYYGKIDFSEYEVYVAIGNGLYTDDISIELAMANSILSSYYKKAIIKQAKGEIRLNGKIIDGLIDNKPISHITELINIYKEK